MKSKVVSIFILILLLAGMLGAFWIASMDHESSAYCPVSSVGVGACVASDAGALSMLNHHMVWVQQISTFVLTNTLFVLIASIFALLAIVFFAIGKLLRIFTNNKDMRKVLRCCNVNLKQKHFKNSHIRYMAILNSLNPDDAHGV